MRSEHINSCTHDTVVIPTDYMHYEVQLTVDEVQIQPDLADKRQPKDGL